MLYRSTRCPLQTVTRLSQSLSALSDIRLKGVRSNEDMLYFSKLFQTFFFNTAFGMHVKKSPINQLNQNRSTRKAAIIG